MDCSPAMDAGIMKMQLRRSMNLSRWPKKGHAFLERVRLDASRVGICLERSTIRCGPPDHLWNGHTGVNRSDRGYRFFMAFGACLHGTREILRTPGALFAKRSRR